MCLFLYVFVFSFMTWNMFSNLDRCQRWNCFIRSIICVVMLDWKLLEVATIHEKTSLVWINKLPQNDHVRMQQKTGPSYPGSSPRGVTNRHVERHSYAGYGLHSVSRSPVMMGRIMEKGSSLQLQPRSHRCVYIHYIPRTQMTLVLIGKGLVLGGLTFKNRGHLGSRYIHAYTGLHLLMWDQFDIMHIHSIWRTSWISFPWQMDQMN